MTHETQESITRWGEETFGPVIEPAALARRTRLEVDELIDALEKGDMREATQEAADILILLSRLAQILGFNLADAVDEKMKLNRARRWAPTGDGTGRHIG